MRKSQSMRMWGCRLVVASIGLLIAWGVVPAHAKFKPKPEERWVTYENPRFGYRLYYPSAIFAPADAQDGDGGLTLTTEDGLAKIVAFGALNDDNLSPREYRRVLLEEFGGYDRLDYQPSGGTWFVLSGFREDNTYYQKVMFSCSNRVINVLSVTFPSSEKPFYERLIEIMEDNFKPARGPGAPEGC